MRVDLGRFVQKQRGNLRALSRTLPAPIRRRLYYARGLADGDLGLPPLPWRVADADADVGEVVAEFEGQFEPKRQAKVFGTDHLPQRLVRRARVTLLRLRRFENVVLLPHQVVLRQADRAVLPVSYELSDHHTRWLTSTRRRPGYVDYNFDGDAHPPKSFDEPIFLADSLYPAFGHTLMDVVPALAMLAGAPPDIKIATSARLYRALIEGSGVAMDRVVQFKGPPFCRTVYIPDQPVDLGGNLHSVAREAFAKLEALAAYSSIERQPRIFLSRAKITARRLENGASVEAMFAQFGFAVVHPEELSIPDQVRLMLAADMVAGPNGSNMHNLVYVRPETRALVLSSSHWFNDIDPYVARADWQFAYATGTPRHRWWQDPAARAWSIDLEVVRHAIHEQFGF